MNHLIKSLGIAAAMCCSVMAYADEFPDGTTIYGYKASGSNAYFYELTQTEPIQKCVDPGYKSSWYVKLKSGWLNDGNFAGYRVDNAGAKAYDLYYVEIDWETGDLIQSKPLSTNNGFLLYATLNPATSTIYGYGYNSDQHLAFMSASVEAPGSFTTIKEVDASEVCYGIAWNATESVLAGMLSDGTLVTIGVDGTQTEILKTNFNTSSYGVNSYSRSQPLVWSQAEKVYYWNAEASSLEEEYLWKIDPENKFVSQVTDYVGGMFEFLMPGEFAAPDAPEIPELVSVDFADGANDGTVTLKMPTKANDGSDLAGTLTWKATLDGAETATGEAQPGAEVIVSYTDVPSGLHAFGFTVSLGDKESSALQLSRFIGVDTPSAPQNVVLTLSTLTWDAVTSGINGGYVSPDLTYEIYLNGELAGTTSETTYEVNLPTTGPLYSVSASVYAVSGELRSAAGVSNPVTAGAAFIPPVELVPTPEEAALFSTIDGYDDGNTWTFNESLGQFQSGYNIYQQMNEWLVLPPVELKAGVQYNFSFQTSRQRNFFDEEFLEVGFGTEATAESLSSDIIIPRFQVPYSPYDFETITAEIEVAESGIYRIGLHSISSADMGNVFVKNFSIVGSGLDASSPAEATDITVEAAEGGELKATVTFTLPTKTIGGDDLDADATLTATVECESTVTVEGKPGEEVSATVATLRGDNTISITVAAGAAVGKKVTVDVFTGEAIPAKVTDLTLTQSADFKSMTLTWNAPTEGYDGGFINPANLTYTVRILKETVMGDLWDDLATGLTETSYVFTTDNDKLEYYSFAVVAVGPSGASPEIAENGGVLGVPYTLPMSEDFSSSNLYSYEPWVTYMPTPEYYTRWGVLPLESVPGIYDESLGLALCGMGMENGCLGMAGFPVFSTEGLNSALLSVKMWTGENAASNMYISGKAYGMTEPVTVGNIVPDGEEEWQTFNFALPKELTNQNWVMLYLNAEFPDGYSQWVVMSEYVITNTSGIAGNFVNGITVSNDVNSLIVECEEAATVSVFNISGAKVADSPSAMNHKISLDKGIYLVRVGAATYKVAIH
ncbi:MAG: hypothetical protein K2K94_09605 [Muribaculaceae bacterium]|nr:hypothetical protein [Muribaculaceae bacterium]